MRCAELTKRGPIGAFPDRDEVFRDEALPLALRVGLRRLTIVPVYEASLLIARAVKVQSAGKARIAAWGSTEGFIDASLVALQVIEAVAGIEARLIEVPLRDVLLVAYAIYPEVSSPAGIAGRWPAS